MILCAAMYFREVKKQLQTLNKLKIGSLSLMLNEYAVCILQLRTITSAFKLLLLLLIPVSEINCRRLFRLWIESVLLYFFVDNKYLIINHSSVCFLCVFPY